MLVALLTLLFLGGGSATAVLTYVADSQDAVKAAVLDDDRRKAALGTLKEMKAVAKNQSKMMQKTVKELKPYVGDQASDDADVEALWEDYFERMQVSDQQMLDLRFTLRDQLTREEWEQVFGESSS